MDDPEERDADGDPESEIDSLLVTEVEAQPVELMVTVPETDWTDDFEGLGEVDTDGVSDRDVVGELLVDGDTDCVLDTPAEMEGDGLPVGERDCNADLDSTSVASVEAVTLPV